MKTVFSRFFVSTLIVFSAFLATTSSQAAGLNSVLDGMFVNATGPSYVSDQLRGGISGGGVYVRSPVSSIQLLAIDLPRFSAGCGGIDAYLGSFSFITADKLIQFLRNVAQNAAPLAFQMALESANPQLSGMLKKFQAIAQQANDLNRNSCQLAHGLLDGKQNFSEVYAGLSKTVGDSVASVEGWFSDFNAAKDNTSSSPSDNLQKAEPLTEPNGKKTIQSIDNITWNALNNREIDGFSFSGIADDTIAAKEIIMSLIGTVINSPGNNVTAEHIVLPYTNLLTIQQLVKPPQNPDGTYGVPIWKCEDTAACKSITTSYYATTGIRGYVNKQMMGTEDVNSSSIAISGSIVYNLTNCNTASCGLSNSQLKFLNAIGSVPAVGLMRRSQKVAGLTNAIAPDLVEEMTNEVAIQYAEAVISIAITSYSGTATPKPGNYDTALAAMRNDLDTLRKIKSGRAERMNVITANIDNSIRAAARVFTSTR